MIALTQAPPAECATMETLEKPESFTYVDQTATACEVMSPLPWFGFMTKTGRESALQAWIMGNIDPSPKFSFAQTLLVQMPALTEPVP